MLRYVKHGEPCEGRVIGVAGAALRVERAGDVMCQELVQRNEAEDQAEFVRTWQSLSPLAAVLWQTEDGPLEIQIF